VDVKTVCIGGLNNLRAQTIITEILNQLSCGDFASIGQKKFYGKRRFSDSPSAVEGRSLPKRAGVGHPKS
jgi:hypothetical protein